MVEPPRWLHERLDVIERDIQQIRDDLLEPERPATVKRCLREALDKLQELRPDVQRVFT